MKKKPVVTETKKPTKLQQLTEENLWLRQDLQAQTESYESQLQEKRDVIESLERNAKSIQKAEAELKSMDIVLHESQSQVLDLSGMLTASKKNARDLAQELANCSENYENCRHTNAESLQEINSLVEEIKALETKTESLVRTKKDWQILLLTTLVSFAVYAFFVSLNR